MNNKYDIDLISLKKNFSVKKFEFIIHILFWFYIITQELYALFMYDVPWYSPYLIAVMLFFHFAQFYFVYFYLFRWFVEMKQKWLGIIFVLAAAFIFVVSRIYSLVGFEKYLLNLPPEVYLSEYNFGNYYNETRSTLIIGVYATLIKFSVQWYKDQKRKSELKMEKQASELALLKSQINPHFLFNTLNNIYSLVYQKSDIAPAAVLKLSEIMRYTLYEANVERVPLKDEIAYIRNYIELQSLRYQKKNIIRMNIECDSDEKYISPMLLIPFIENAFKHSDKGNGMPPINLDILCSGEKILFSIENYYLKEKTICRDKNRGIGLANVKRRLDLIYSENYKLDINESENKYSVKLELKNI
ncbi:MAG: sensor histidine kinase [Ignavibacteria bacterium]|nr:sensor histidine kinase [Ignavibacteria bacterium]